MASSASNFQKLSKHPQAKKALGVVGHALGTQNQSSLRPAKASRFVRFRWQCHFSPQSARGLLVSAD
jgi:hypothetical protein